METRLRRSLGMQLCCGIMFCALAFSQQQPEARSNTEPSPLTGLKVEHITFSVANIDRETDWLGKVFGFKIFRSGGEANSTSRNLSIPGFRIDLIQLQGSSRPPVPNPRDLQQGFIHVVFQVPDLEAAYRQLKVLNQDVMREYYPGTELWGLKLDDPEGNEFELTQYGHV